MPYTVLRGRWCNVFGLNAHAAREEKSDDSKDSVCEELEHVFDNFPKYRMKILTQWLRCCATNRKVAGSIPDGVIGIFH